jgi:hypothetical protein
MLGSGLLAMCLVVAVAFPAGAAEYVPGPDSLMLEVRDTVVVDEGYLYLHGHPLDPPYVFEIAGDSLYAELYVNDYIAQVIDRRPAEPESLGPHEALSREVRERLRTMSREGTHSLMERTEAAAEVYRKHPELIESVTVTDPGVLGVVAMDASGEPYYETVIISSPRQTPPPTAYSLVKAVQNKLTMILEWGYTAFHGSGTGGWYPSLPDSSFYESLKEAPEWYQAVFRNPPELQMKRR